jgi:hypothetical protein
MQLCFGWLEITSETIYYYFVGVVNSLEYLSSEKDTPSINEEESGDETSDVMLIFFFIMYINVYFQSKSTNYD